jgi:hypothetical protein
VLEDTRLTPGEIGLSYHLRITRTLSRSSFRTLTTLALCSRLVDVHPSSQGWRTDLELCGDWN